jgi:putative methyltransferase (TIGR04325 family)
VNARHLIRQILPPVVTDLLEALRSRPPAPLPEWEYLPDGWQDGGEDAQGWNVESVATSQRRKWPRFVSLATGNGPLGISHEAAMPVNTDHGAHATIMSFGYVAALASRHADALSVLDWGGGVGHYGVLARTLLPGVALEYHCKDLPLLCEAGRELQPEAAFHTDETSCFSRRYDLVMASGSLHYSRDWRATMQALAAAAESWLYLTRIPLVERSPSFVVRQRPSKYGYDTEYCGWFLNRGEILDHAAAIGLSLMREFLVAESPQVENAPERCRYGGFLFRTRAATARS